MPCGGCERRAETVTQTLGRYAQAFDEFAQENIADPLERVANETDIHPISWLERVWRALERATGLRERSA